MSKNKQANHTLHTLIWVKQEFVHAYTTLQKTGNKYIVLDYVINMKHKSSGEIHDYG